MITENLSTLKIHKLTQTQYNRELNAGRIDETALYLTPDNIKPIYEYAQECGYIGTEEQFAKVFSNPTGISEPILLKFAIKPTTDPATSLHIQDSAKYRVLDIGMQGKTEQYTTTGAQLWDEIMEKGFISENGNVIVNSGLYWYSPSYISVPKGKPFFNSKINEARGTYYVCYYDENKQYLSKEKIYSYFNDLNNLTWNDAAKYIRFFIEIQNTPSEIKSLLGNTMITYTNNATYEPYTGGIPSPNTEFPQEIEHAGTYNEETGRYEIDVEVSNKNIFKPTIKATHQSTANLDGDKYVFVNTATSGVSIVRSELFTLKRGIKYIFSLHDCINLERVLVWVDGDTTKPIGQFSKSYTFNYTPTKNINVQFGIYMLDISTLGNTAECRIQVEEDTVSTPYIPHESQKVTLTPPREFTKWDKLVKKDGLYGFVYRKIDLGFTGNWFVSDTYKGFLHLLDVYLGDSVRDGFCNQAIVKESNDNEEGALILKYQNKEQSAFYMINSRFYDESLSDKGLANWKAHLSENPLEVCTYTNEEEYIPVTDEEQAALEALETYYGVTNISNSEECEMSIQYVADTKLYVDNKILEIQSAVI